MHSLTSLGAEWGAVVLRIRHGLRDRPIVKTEAAPIFANYITLVLFQIFDWQVRSISAKLRQQLPIVAIVPAIAKDQV